MSANWLTQDHNVFIPVNGFFSDRKVSELVTKLNNSRKVISDQSGGAHLYVASEECLDGEDVLLLTESCQMSKYGGTKPFIHKQDWPKSACTLVDGVSLGLSGVYRHFEKYTYITALGNRLVYSNIDGMKHRFLK